MSNSRGHKLQTHCLRAFVFNLEISRHCFRPDVQGMRLAGMAILQHPQLGGRLIELGLIVQDDGGAGGGRKGGQLPFRPEVLVKMRHVVGEIEFGAALLSASGRRGVILDPALSSVPGA